MDLGRNRRWVLPCCIAASLLIHAVGLLALADPSSALARAILLPEEDRAPEVRLGIEESRSVSIAWIGFEEATPHSAREAETLQPALSPEATSAAVRAAEQAAASASAVTESLLERVTDLSELAARLESTRAAAEARAAAQKPAKSNDAVRSTPSTAQSEAIPDDRESDATSPKLAIRQDQLGQVLARQGLRIQTFRPQFDATTRQFELRSRRGRVTAVIQFAKSGSVFAAAIKPGTATGIPTIDEPILDSVYRWRAVGTDLEALPSAENATITIEIEIIF